MIAAALGVGVVHYWPSGSDPHVTDPAPKISFSPTFSAAPQPLNVIMTLISGNRTPTFSATDLCVSISGGPFSYGPDGWKVTLKLPVPATIDTEALVEPASARVQDQPIKPATSDPTCPRTSQPALAGARIAAARRITLVSPGVPGSEISFRIHWDSPPSSLIAESAGRLAMQFPEFRVRSEFSAEKLHLSVADRWRPIGDYTIDSGSAPDYRFRYSAGAPGWDWTAPVIGLDSPGILVPAAHSVGREDEEHFNEFLAGICIGLAGGALIGALQTTIDRLSEDRRTST